MKFKLQAGGELDVITPDEAKEIVKSAIADARETGSEDPLRPESSDATNAAGAVTIVVYTVPQGREFVLTRLVVDADGFTPGAPFNAAAGFIDLLRSGERVDFLKLAVGSSQLPAAFPPASKGSGIRFRNGERIEVSIVGGPASTTVRARAQGWLRTPIGERRTPRVRRAPATIGVPE